MHRRGRVTGRICCDLLTEWRFEMSMFTFVLDYRGGTYISQVEALNVTEALGRWVDVVDLKHIYGLTNRSKAVFREGFLETRIVRVRGVVGVWSVSALVRGKLAGVHVVETKKRGERAESGSK